MKLISSTHSVQKHRACAVTHCRIQWWVFVPNSAVQCSAECVKQSKGQQRGRKERRAVLIGIDHYDPVRACGARENRTERTGQDRTAQRFILHITQQSPFFLLPLLKCRCSRCGSSSSSSCSCFTLFGFLTHTWRRERRDGWRGEEGGERYEEWREGRREEEGGMEGRGGRKEGIRGIDGRKGPKKECWMEG